MNTRFLRGDKARRKVKRGLRAWAALTVIGVPLSKRRQKLFRKALGEVATHLEWREVFHHASRDISGKMIRDFRSKPKH